MDNFKMYLRKLTATELLNMRKRQEQFSEKSSLSRVKNEVSSLNDKQILVEHKKGTSTLGDVQQECLENKAKGKTRLSSASEEIAAQGAKSIRTGT